MSNLAETIEKLGKRAASKLDRVRAWALLTSRLDYETATRRKLGSDTKNIGKLKLGFALLLCALLVSVFCIGIGHYFDWLETYEGSPEVYNLTRQRVEWNVFYGKSARCGDYDCLVLPDARESDFQRKMILPAREFPLVGYAQGQMIYLRTRITIPDKLLRDREPLVLQTLMMWAKHFDLFLDGHLLSAGGNETLFVTIPAEWIPSSRTVTLSFRIDPGNLPYQGIANRTDLILGKKNFLLPLSSASIEYKKTYYLWFLLPKMVVCIIFSLLFVLAYRYSEIFLVLVFGFMSWVSLYLNSDYRPDVLMSHLKIMDGRSLYFVFDAYAQLALLKFFHEYYRRHSIVFNWAFAAMVAGITCFESFFLWDTNLRSALLSASYVDRLSDLLHAVSVLYGTTLSVLTALYLAANERSRFRYFSSTVMATFLLASIVIFGIKLSGVVPSGAYGITENIFDLAFFLILSGIVATEFGISLTQQNVIKGAFLRFVDHLVVERAIKGDSRLLPQQRNISVLAIDIRSFTQICNVFPPDSICEMLEEFRSEFVPIIQNHGGHIDKYIGDAIMAEFGAPKDLENHGLAAVLAALELRKALIELNSRRAACGKFEITIGVGIASGICIVGELGANERSEYSAFGPVVNEAFALESVARIESADIMLSEATWLAVRNRAVVSPIRNKGRSRGGYKLIGILTENGNLLVTNDQQYDEFLRLNGYSEPGVIDFPISSLKLHDYRSKAS